MLFPLLSLIELILRAHTGYDRGFDPFTLVHAIWLDVPQPWSPILDRMLLLLTPPAGAAATAGSLHALNFVAQGWGRDQHGGQRQLLPGAAARCADR